MIPKDEVQGIDYLLYSHPNLNTKDIHQGLKSFGKDFNFMVDNSTPNATYPKFDVAMYFQTYNLQSETLRNAISQLNQEVSTDLSWINNLEDSNASRITDLEMVLGNADVESNLQTAVQNSFADVG